MSYKPHRAARVAPVSFAYKATLLLFLLTFTACTNINTLNDLGDFSDSGKNINASKEILLNDPGGSIDEPQIPSEIKAQAEAAKQSLYKSPVTANKYTLLINSPLESSLAEDLRQSSVLEKMRDEDDFTLTSIRQRLALDLKQAEKILHAYGYYDGSLTSNITRTRLTDADKDSATDLEGLPEKENAEKINPKASSNTNDHPATTHYTITIEFECGQQYKVREAQISVLDPAKIIPQNRAFLQIPTSLFDLRLKEEAGAVAKDILASVDEAEQAFTRIGYPHAKVHSSKYLLNYSKKELNAYIVIDSGDFMRMGDLALTKESNVNAPVFHKLKNWRAGQPWNSALIDNYIESLRQIGVFASVEIQPSESSNALGEHEVLLTTEPSPERTIGTSVSYDSDLGAGLLAYWEHRNFSQNADSLRIDIPLWEETQF